MNRRDFITAAALSTACAATAMAQDKSTSPAKGHGACGLSCAACRMYLNGKCKGCGQGAKAECAILKCAQMKKLAYCAQCKGYPCPKIKNSGKFGNTWLDKMGNAPVPKS